MKSTIDETLHEAIEQAAQNPGSVKLEYPVHKAWESLLESIDTVRSERFTPAATLALLNQWPNLKLGNFEDYKAAYYGFLDQARDVLAKLLAKHDEAENELEDDGEVNQEFYESVLAEWNFLAWQASVDWSDRMEASDEGQDRLYASLIGLTAAQDALLNPGTGIVAWLGQIKFKFGQDVQDRVNAQIQEKIDEVGGVSE